MQPPAQGQQEQLQQLLSQLGVDLPVSAIPAFPTGSTLHKWLLETLSSCAAAHPGQRQAGHRDDLHNSADQDQQPSAAPAWLAPAPRSEQQALKAARCMEPVHEAQLRELQHLDRALGKQLQALQQSHDHTALLLHDRSRQLSAQQSSIKDSNSQFNRQLQALYKAVEEAQQQVAVHGSSWLLIAADMAAYIKANAAYSHCLERLVIAMSSKAATSSGGGGSDGVTSSLTAPGPGWDGHTTGYGSVTARVRAAGSWQLASDLTAEEHDALIQEMARLRVAYSLGELDDVMARVTLAGATAQVAKLRQMLQDEAGASQGHGYTPWLHPAECERLAARIHALQKEAEGLRKELPVLIERVGQLQDAYLLQGDYERLAARKQASIQDKQTVVDALSGWGAQGLILDKLRSLDLSKLQEVHKTIHDLSDALSQLVATSHQRCTVYNQICSPAAAATPPPASPLTVRSPATSAAQSMRHRQQIEDHSYLDVLHQVLHEQLPPVPPAKPPLPPPATIKSVTAGLQRLATSHSNAEHMALGLSSQGLPGLVSEAVGGARAAKEALCEPGQPGVVPVTRACKLVQKQAELEQLNAQLQERLNEVVNATNAYQSYRRRVHEPENLDRMVLSAFHTQPDWLLAQVKELQARLEALQATAHTSSV